MHGLPAGMICEVASQEIALEKSQGGCLDPRIESDQAGQGGEE